MVLFEGFGEYVFLTLRGESGVLLLFQPFSPRRRTTSRGCEMVGAAHVEMMVYFV